MKLTPIVGLLNDSVLPGERRPVDDRAADPPTQKRLRAIASAAKQHTVCAVSIASAVEFPSMLVGRWGTVGKATIVDDKIVIEGESRARIVSVSQESGGAVAELDVREETPETAPLIEATHRLFAALGTGARPVDVRFADRLPAAIAPVLRAIAGDAATAALLEAPTIEAIGKLTDDVLKKSAGAHAACALEPALKALAAKPELPETLRRQLWSQTVEIQRRLDLFDPDAAESSTELTRLQRKLAQAGLPRDAREVAKSTFKLLRGMSASHHDYSTHLSKLELLAKLPWHSAPEKQVDLDAVRAALDAGHAGLEKVKKRILEYFAVRMLRGRASASVLCLDGPPGVGKTTIARAIATAMGRPFVRIPLGGVHDECEIRGHRQSFTSASSGRVIAGFAQCPTNDPVVLLDELDKLGTEQARSPSAALLEVLDPEQNSGFTDNFLAVPYDLSNALFIATTNDIDRLEPALHDRLEAVELEGYTSGEKLAIAEKHLLERVREDHGLTAPLAIDRDTLQWLIASHTREAGVRQLQRTLAALARDEALAIATKRPARGAFDRGRAREVLGPPKFRSDEAATTLAIGVAQGLATVGGTGTILRIEAATAPGKGEIVATGSLGVVMTESVRTVLGYLRSNAARHRLDDAHFARDLFVHAPDAASPKDGPSAGIAIAVALVSAMRGEAASARVAMTGEVSLSGDVLPVGGVRAKLLAAERAGVTKVIIPKENEHDVPTDVRVEIVLVSRVADAIDAAFQGVSSAPSTSISAASTTTGTPA